MQNIGGHLRHTCLPGHLYELVVHVPELLCALLLALLQPLVGLAQLLLALLHLMRHQPEGAGQLPQLVPAGLVQLDVEVASGHLVRRLGEGQQRAGDLLPEHPEHDGQLQQQRHQPQQQHVARRAEGGLGHHPLRQHRDEGPVRTLQAPWRRGGPLSPPGWTR